MSTPIKIGVSARAVPRRNLTHRPRIGLAVLFVAIALALLIPWSGSKAANSYYVFDGNSLVTVFDSPSNAHADQWAAFYFKKGTSPTEISQRWGMDLGSTPDEVLHNVEINQNFEKRYEKWCLCSWGPNTFFNSVAPVAMVKEASALRPRQVEILAKAHSAWDRVQGLIGRFNKAADLASELKLPRLGGTGPFADFMGAMHASIDQFMAISSQGFPVF